MHIATGLILITFVALITACDFQTENQEESIKFAKPEMHGVFVQKLKEAGLWFRVDGTNKVWYKYSDHEKIQAVKWDIIHNAFPANRYWNSNPRVYSFLLEKMKKEQIPYNFVQVNDKKHIEWDSKYSSQMSQIRAETLTHEHEMKIREQINEINGVRLD